MLVEGALKQSARSSKEPKRVTVLGCTGSIGDSALAIARAYPQQFEIVGLAAGSNLKKLLQLVAEFKPALVALADRQVDAAALEALLQSYGGELLRGNSGVCELARASISDVVLAAIVGAAGLESTLAALSAGKTVALANKESLVVAGALSLHAQQKSGALLIPVDSEHSALFQAMRGARIGEVEKLWLTASGGPFLRSSAAEMERVTPQVAINHPRWKMGPKISVDSASLVNKALELIEAHWLFGLSAEQIDIVIHPQSIVHSLVEFRDRVQIAQLSHPDMRAPIAYALGFPDGRLDQLLPHLSLAELGKLEFEPLDGQRFRAPQLARAALARGGAMCAVFNYANEIAVARFLEGKCGFGAIVPLIEDALASFDGARAETLQDLNALELEIRNFKR